MNDRAQLVRYDAMCHAIAECHDVDEVKGIHDKALAMDLYARQAMNLDAERQAVQIRLRAERKAGDLMRELDRAPAGADRNPHGRAGKPEPTSTDFTQVPKSQYAETLERAGVSRQTAKTWQDLSKVPEEQFEQALNAPGIAGDSGNVGRLAGEPDMGCQARHAVGRSDYRIAARRMVRRESGISPAGARGIAQELRARERRRS